MPALFRLMLPEPRTRNRLAADLLVLRQDLFPINRHIISVGLFKARCWGWCGAACWADTVAILLIAGGPTEAVRPTPTQRAPRWAVRLGIDAWASLPSMVAASLLPCLLPRHTCVNGRWTDHQDATEDARTDSTRLTAPHRPLCWQP